MAASCSCLDDNFAIVRQIDNNRHWTIISASCLADTTAMPVKRSSSCAVLDVGEYNTAYFQVGIRDTRAERRDDTVMQHIDLSRDKLKQYLCYYIL